MARLRSAAERAPQTKDQAVALLERVAVYSAEVAAIEARRANLLARVNGAADAMLVPIAAQIKDAVKQLKPWWAANFDELTEGKRKSIALGGCQVGYRIGNPTVKFANGDDDDAVAALQVAELADRLVRTKPSLDKPAILTALAEKLPATEGEAPAPSPLADQLISLGFSIKQTETFFVDPLKGGPSEDARVTID